MAQLSDALAAARIGAWHKILKIECGSDTAKIERARRTLQRSAHPDKGGSEQLSKLINEAADTLLRQSAGGFNAEWSTWLKQERAAKAAEEGRREEEERCEEEERRDAAEAERERLARAAATKAAEAKAAEAKAAEAKAAEAKAAEAKAAEAKAAERLAARTAVAEAALSHQSKRGAKARSKVYLSPSTRRLFPRIGDRILVLQKKGQWEKSRCLAYAAEAEVAARRGVRETTFPKTAGLASRDPIKAQLLTALKKRYIVSYSRVRYLRGKTTGVTLARLHMAWILREAWAVLLSQPPPIMDETVMPMEGL